MNYKLLTGIFLLALVVAMPSAIHAQSTNSSPDLVSQISSSSYNLGLGQQATISITTQNVGAIAAGNSVTSDQVTYSPSIASTGLTDYYYVPGLAPGAEVTNTSTLQCPTTDGVEYNGVMTFTATPNYNNLVSENNTSSGSSSMSIQCGSGSNQSSGPISISTDKQSYNNGDDINVLIHSQPVNPITLYGCATPNSVAMGTGESLMQFTDPSGNYVTVYAGGMYPNGTIAQTPETTSPSDCNIPVQNIGSGTIQYRIGASDFAQDLQLSTPGTYTITLQGAGWQASTSFYYTGSTTTSNSTGNVVLSTDSSAYAGGQPVTVDITNDGSTAYSYRVPGCGLSFGISDSNSNALVVNNPYGPSCDSVMAQTLQPGQTADLGQWDQLQYLCTSAAGDCSGTQVPSGTYTATFAGLSSPAFSIGSTSGGNNTPPMPPNSNEYTVTLNLNPGWNMVSVPVFDSKWLVGSRPLATPTPSGKAKGYYENRGDQVPSAAMPEGLVSKTLDLVNNSCSIQSIWAYGSYYYQVDGVSQMKPNTGYWVQAQGACSITFQGNAATTASNYLSSLHEGWNLVSAPYSTSGSTPLSSLGGTCQNDMTSGPWYYDPTMGQYVQESSLATGQAYWIQASNYCTLGGPQSLLPPAVPSTTGDSQAS